MGIVYQHIRLANAAKPEIEEIDANALVDSGAYDLCIPEVVERDITLADGRVVRVDYVGPIKIEVFGRHAFTGGMVTGNQVLLGAIPMQAMDVLIDPRRHQLIPNPAHPHVPGGMAVGALPAGEGDHA
jgi:hypothetical protein